MKLSRGILEIKQVLMCSVCDEPVSECAVCGGIFVNNESVYCDDDNLHSHHYHLNCRNQDGTLPKKKPLGYKLVKKTGEKSCQEPLKN